MKLEPAFKINNSITFRSTDSLINFLEKEIQFWEGVSRSSSYTQSPLYAYTICNHLLAKINAAISNPTASETSVQTEIKNAFNVRQLNPASFFSNFYLESTSPLAIKIQEIASSEGEHSAYIFWRTIKNDKFDPQDGISNENFKGLMLAYEYSVSKSDLPKRRATNKKSISEYHNQLSKLDIESRDKISTLIEDTHSNCSDLLSSLSETHQNAEKQLTEQITDNDNIFNEELKVWATEKNRLEKLYKEDLKLRPAADYWKEAAAKHERLAIFSSMILAIVAFISIAAISSFFYRWVETFGNPEFKPASLQGVLIFAVIVAIIGFVLKVLSRIIFSSLHLSRDAEEREQLTYFYLALSNESDMSGSDRNLVLTSLFSRSETGLLTNEHGPTLPIADAVRTMKN